jgi:fibro-slime domain-containing protein
MSYRSCSSSAVLVVALLSFACSSGTPSVDRGIVPASGGSGTDSTVGGTSGTGAGGDSGSTTGGSGGQGGTSVVVLPSGGGDAGTGGDSAKPSVCGDGRVDPKLKEECDDGNVAAMDGCSDTCTVEPGWACPFPGLPCEAAKCGDGIRVGKEACDFGATATEGCDPTTCTVTPGYACDATSCHATVCGDKVAEGSEGCDDGNDNWGDGCTPDCKREPDCSGAACATTCGDGLLLPGNTTEACDDGNDRADDGCSATCVVEPGYVCMPAGQAETGKLVLPIVYRDMIQRMDPGGHPNFEVMPTRPMLFTGIVGPLGSPLDMDGKPLYATTPETDTTNATNGWTTNATDFSTWFRDSDYSKTVLDSLTLTETPAGSGTFVFAETQFFPLDGLGWNDVPIDGSAHNYSFTSELHYWFQWAGGEVLTFFGDDDVFVYVNKKLAVDIGGIHGPITQSVTLDDATNTTLGLGLVQGSVYEIAVFQAERHVTGSQYELTLEGFNVGRSECKSVCGDGIVTPDELCDEGTDQNTGGYGRCAPDCKTRGGFCGDGIVQTEGHEACDDGNTTLGDGCDSTCQREGVR